MDAAEARAMLLKILNPGPKVVNYTGHGLVNYAGATSSPRKMSLG